MTGGNGGGEVCFAATIPLAQAKGNARMVLPRHSGVTIATCGSALLLAIVSISSIRRHHQRDAERNPCHRQRLVHPIHCLPAIPTDDPHAQRLRDHRGGDIGLGLPSNRFTIWLHSIDSEISCFKSHKLSSAFALLLLPYLFFQPRCLTQRSQCTRQCFLVTWSSVGKIHMPSRGREPLIRGTLPSSDSATTSASALPPSKLLNGGRRSQWSQPPKA